MKALRPTLPGLIVLAVLASGCATVPEPLGGEFRQVTPEQSGDQHVDQRVRWGGSIVDTRPGKSETCIEILSQSLDERARPHAGSDNQGRFLACREGFEDPAEFESGRDITVVGTLTGFVEGNIGEFNYIYPRVDAATLFLWEEQAPSDHYYYHPHSYYPWWPYARYSRYHYPRRHFSGHIVIRR